MQEVISKHKNWFGFASILLISLACRIPYFTSANFLPDLDECISGIMGLHLMGGENFPVFFYGQQYGFCLPETILIALSLGTNEVSALSLKLPMLLLYAGGLFFFHRFLVERLGWLMSFFGVLVFACMPVWIVWSMKARGGYLTAFFCSFALIFLLQKPALTKPKAVVGGLLFACLYHSNLLWWTGWLIPVFYYLTKQEKPIFSHFLLSTVFGWLVLYLLAKNNSTFWTLPNSEWSGTLNFNDIKHKLFVFFGGSFYLDKELPRTFGIRTLANFWIYVLLLGLIGAGLMAWRRTLSRETMVWLSATILLLLVPLIRKTDLFQFRYWLPMSCAAVIFGATLLERVLPDRKKHLLLFLLSTSVFSGCLGAAAAWGLGKPSLYQEHFDLGPDPEKKVLSLCKRLGTLENTHLFFSDPRLMWLVTYYSAGQVTGRYHFGSDRHMPFVEGANKTVEKKNNGYLIGSGYSPISDSLLVVFKKRKTVPVEGFFLVENLTKNQLEVIGFTFKKNPK